MTERQVGDPRSNDEVLREHIDIMWRGLDLASTQYEQAAEILGSEENPLAIAESLITLPLRGPVGLTFNQERLDGLEGFTIGKNNGYRIVVSERLDPQSRIFAYFHAFGHIARGHLVGAEIGVLFEPRNRTRLPAENIRQDQEANEWAAFAVENRSPDSFLGASVRGAVLNRARTFSRPAAESAL